MADNDLADKENNKLESKNTTASESDYGEGSAVTLAGNAAVVDSEVTENQVAEDPDVAVVHQQRNTIAWLALLLALLAVSAAGYSAWVLLQQHDELQSLAVNADSHREQVNDMQRAMNNTDRYIKDELAHRDGELQALRTALVDANAVIEGHSRRLLSLTATTTDDWRLAEVEYLLRLANQRILTSKDSAAALSLLQASDQILLALDDPRLFAIRAAIAEDRAALSAVGNQDVEGVFLRLSALQSQIDTLPVLVVPDFTPVDPAVQPDQTGEAQHAAVTTFNRIARSTWDQLKGLVVVQKQRAEIKPLLPPEQQYYLRNNLRLLLNQAQLALLDGRQQTYENSLDNAKQWLIDFFPIGEPAVDAVIADIDQVAGIQVDVDLPDIANSLLAIKAFIAEQHRIGGKKDESDIDRDTGVNTNAANRQPLSVNESAPRVVAADVAGAAL